MTDASAAADRCGRAADVAARRGRERCRGRRREV